MKKIVTLAFILTFSLVLAACGKTGADNKDPEVRAAKTETGATTKKAASSSQSPGQQQVYAGTEGLDLETVYENAALNITKETGPFKYSLDGIQVAKASVSDEEIAGDMEIQPGQEFATVAFHVTIENTSDQPSSIYFTESSPSLTTNTEKNIMPDMWLTDTINEDYEPHETKEGVIVFAMLDSKAEDIHSMTMTVSAPYDTITYEDAGEETTVDYSW